MNHGLIGLLKFMEFHDEEMEEIAIPRHLVPRKLFIVESEATKKARKEAERDYA